MTRRRQRDPQPPNPPLDALQLLIHELRSPVAAIRLTTATIRTLGDTAESMPWFAHLRTVERSTEHIEQLLASAAAGQRLRPPATTTIIPNGLVVECLEMLRPILASRPLRVDMACGRPIFGNRVRLRQAVINVLVNAVKYSPPGSPIGIGLREDGDRVVIVVSDHGPGLNPDAAGTHDGAPQGAGREMSDGSHGMGLRLARDVLAEHGGRLDYHRDNEVTTFKLSLPLAT